MLKIGLHTCTNETKNHEIQIRYILPRYLYSHGLEKTSSTPIPGPSCLDFKILISFSASIHQAFLDARFHVVFFKGNAGIGPKVGPRLNFMGKQALVKLRGVLMIRLYKLVLVVTNRKACEPLRHCPNPNSYESFTRNTKTKPISLSSIPPKSKIGKQTSFIQNI